MSRTCRWLLMGALLSMAACSSDPETAKRAYLKSGDGYAKQQKYREAVIEYRNAVQQDPKFGEARFKLAETYERLGDLPNAYREYMRAADLLPDDAQAQLKAGGLLLLAGQFEDAKARVEKLLAKSPNNIDGQILLGNALVGLKDLDGALKEVEQAVQIDPSQSRSYASLGALQYVRGDKVAAEQAFKKAIETDPKSALAHLALANFYWASGRTNDAEVSLKKAVEVAPKDLAANRMMATFLMAVNRNAEAEPFFKALTENSPDPGPRLALADYYLRTDRAEDALTALKSIPEGTSAYPEAQVRMAAVYYAQGKQDDGHRLLDAVLAKESNNVPALLLKARFLLGDHKVDDALARAKAAATADPKSAEAQYLLGMIYERKNEAEPAIAAYNEVLKINPRVAAAQTHLAALHLATGRGDLSVQLAEQAKRNDPNNDSARFVYARGLLTTGDLAKAEEEMRPLLVRYPTAASVQSLMGLIWLSKGNRTAARQSFDQALRADQNFVEALGGLTTLDLMDKNAKGALARVDAAVARVPQNAGVLVLAAKVHAATGDLAGSEQLVKKTIQQDQSNLSAYSLLAQIYLRQRKLDQALAELNEIATRQPKAVWARTMSGMILEGQGKQAEARKQYEQTLQVDPRAAVAANNLAWIYAETGGNLDVALQLAQTAQSVLPEQPEVSDTLGWIYYKKDLATLAIPVMKQSIARDPRNPIYHFHLGLAYAKADDPKNARTALEQSLKLKPDFQGADEARKALAGLKG